MRGIPDGATIVARYGSALKDFLPKGVIEREADIPLVYGKDTMD